MIIIDILFNIQLKAKSMNYSVRIKLYHKARSMWNPRRIKLIKIGLQA